MSGHICHYHNLGRGWGSIWGAEVLHFTGQPSTTKNDLVPKSEVSGLRNSDLDLCFHFNNPCPEWEDGFLKVTQQVRGTTCQKNDLQSLEA